jgi:hypothetical protein
MSHLIHHTLRPCTMYPRMQSRAVQPSTGPPHSNFLTLNEDPRSQRSGLSKAKNDIVGSKGRSATKVKIISHHNTAESAILRMDEVEEARTVHRNHGSLPRRSYFGFFHRIFQICNEGIHHRDRQTLLCKMESASEIEGGEWREEVRTTPEDPQIDVFSTHRACDMDSSGSGQGI